MSDDPTPINARQKWRQPEALEDLSLALREHVVWPLQDGFLGLGDRGRAAVAAGAAVLALGIGIGGYSLVTSDGSEPTAARQVAVAAEPAPEPAPPEPQPAPEPTLQGATPVFKASEEGEASKPGEAKPVTEGAAAATASNTGNAATDTITSTPAAPLTGAGASAAKVNGPVAGPAAIAVARKFATAFVVYETGTARPAVRMAFEMTATPELTKALMERPPRQPAGVEVPKAKVLNVVAAPSHEGIYPVSVSLLRVGSTSELRLEMEQMKKKRWRVANVLG